jgi:hypothetical protein
MIYSKFGTALTLVSKTEHAGGRVTIQATEAGGPADIHEYNVGDLKADEGLTEIQAAVLALPARSVGTGTRRRRRED